MCDTKMIGRDAAKDRPFLATSSEFSKAGEQLFDLQPSSKQFKAFGEIIAQVDNKFE